MEKTNLKTTQAKTQNIETQKNTGFCFEFEYDSKKFKFNDTDFEKINLSENQKNIKKNATEFDTIKKLEKMGFSKKEAICYVFPEIKNILNKLKIAIECEEEPDTVSVVSNSCRLVFEEGKYGTFINEFKFFESFYQELERGNKNINIKIETEDFATQKINKNEYTEKSCFSTNFESSSAARKNNIRVALSKFDGVVLEDGEILSFNATTGIRNAESGYMSAKIISGGTFTEGFGGGVCQVSTTLYNACLLSGLEIQEVHNHSLPVSYVEPSFDAMVNVGSSDLVIRNNSGGRIIFTTSYENDICKVKIFGKKNKYKITRFSEKTKIIPAEAEEIVTDTSKVIEYGLAVGEEKRISYAKDGFCSNGYLNYYDKNGNLVKTQKIRSNRYNPTRGIVVKNVG